MNNTVLKIINQNFKYMLSVKTCRRGVCEHQEIVATVAHASRKEFLLESLIPRANHTEIQFVFKHIKLHFENISILIFYPNHTTYRLAVVQVLFS